MYVFLLVNYCIFVVSLSLIYEHARLIKANSIGNEEFTPLYHPCAGYRIAVLLHAYTQTYN